MEMPEGFQSVELVVRTSDSIDDLAHALQAQTSPDETETPGETPADAKRKENDKVNAAIAKLDDGEMIHFLDIAGSFLDDKGALSRKIMPDLLHLSPQGYQIWADAIEPSVAKLMK